MSTSQSERLLAPCFIVASWSDKHQTKTDETTNNNVRDQRLSIDGDGGRKVQVLPVDL